MPVLSATRSISRDLEQRSRVPSSMQSLSNSFVKHIWEQQQGKTAKYRHDVHCLFQQLEPKTQRDVLALYDKCCRAYKKAIQTGKQQHGSETVAVDMANLEEALQWNQHAMRDLKYEMTPSGRSVPTGIFWNSKHLWVLPSTFRTSPSN